MLKTRGQITILNTVFEHLDHYDHIFLTHSLVLLITLFPPQRMNNAVKAEAPKEKTLDNRKPQNPEALRSQEQKVAHDKVSRLRFHIATSS